jgi:hypothetical protein
MNIFLTKLGVPSLIYQPKLGATMIMLAQAASVTSAMNQVLGIIAWVLFGGAVAGIGIAGWAFMTGRTEMVKNALIGGAICGLGLPIAIALFKAGGQNINAQVTMPN